VASNTLKEDTLRRTTEQFDHFSSGWVVKDFSCSKHLKTSYTSKRGVK
jgi:hypothetical protein